MGVREVSASALDGVGVCICTEDRKAYRHTGFKVVAPALIMACGAVCICGKKGEGACIKTY